ncbi:hypothetical protein FJT64_003379 [Amphibalanus amphitrite]|uniref:Uncharacterized protein n=1 Tax=Amphibalanus amphitrite TaxID=1232801 RepID=A0A6A4WD94_AMPAM|nr:hypothetical protein FJT64_003379 [Amphibalanus amphitrite]
MERQLCPYATLYRPAESAVDGHGFTAVHCGSLPTALASDLTGQLEPLYADPRQRLQSLPAAGAHQRQRVRSLPVSDEYDSPDSDSNSPGRPSQVRSASLRRVHRSHSRERRRAADSSSSSGQVTPELRSRSLSSRRARRKRRRARTPVLLPPAGDLGRRGRSAAELQSLLQQQLQLQQQLAAHRAAETAERADLGLRSLAHTLAGRDFSINV